MGPKGPTGAPTGISEFVCPNCKEELVANREEMIISTRPKELAS